MRDAVRSCAGVAARAEGAWPAGYALGTVGLLSDVLSERDALVCMGDGASRSVSVCLYF